MNHKPPIDQQLQARRYDPNLDPPQQQIVMLIQMQNIGTLQNFITVTGVEKAGKGRFIAGMLAAAITNNEVFGIRIRTPELRRRVALFDTEQSDFHFYKNLQTVKKLCALESFPPSFDAFCTREDEPCDRIKMIEHYLKTHPDCSVLFIDGMLDLAYTFNDERHCSRLVQTVMRWTKQHECFIVLVLHRSKNTGNTIGHLGSFTNRKSQSVLLVEKDHELGYVVLKPEYLRDSAGFDPIAIHYNKYTHTWEETLYEPEHTETRGRQRKRTPEELDIADHALVVGQVFAVKEIQTWGEIVQALRELHGVGESWARDCFKHLIKLSLIYRIDTGKYTNLKQTKMQAI